MRESNRTQILSSYYHAISGLKNQSSALWPSEREAPGPAKRNSGSPTLVPFPGTPPTLGTPGRKLAMPVLELEEGGWKGDRPGRSVRWLARFVAQRNQRLRPLPFTYSRGAGNCERQRLGSLWRQQREDRPAKGWRCRHSSSRQRTSMSCRKRGFSCRRCRPAIRAPTMRQEK
jgi:hypothetical protein